MGNKQVRLGQLIAPFGPGSIYTDRRGVPHIIAGLDHWFKQWNQTAGRMELCSDRAEFERFEPRLSALLHVDRFCTAPDYRAVFRGGTAPPNAALHVPALRFPRWYRHTKTGEMRRFNLDTSRVDNPAGGGRWQPVRFISVCAAGHISDFPWKQWIGCQCPGDGRLRLTDRGGSELSSIKVECLSCPDGSGGSRGRSLAGTTIRPDVLNGEQSEFGKEGITCPGDRPWLGEGASEANCTEPLIGALINQTNLYFPRTIAAITLPAMRVQSDAIARLRVQIQEEQAALGIALTRWRMGGEEREDVAADINRKLKRRGVEATESEVFEALESLFDASTRGLPEGAALPAEPEYEFLAFRRAEFNIIRREVNDPEHVPDLRVIQSDVPGVLSQWIAKVNLVERLRETRAFYGFDRLERSSGTLAQMPGAAMRQLFRTPPTQPQDFWLPAIEVFGEGIYVELHEDCIQRWQSQNATWLRERLDDSFVVRLTSLLETLPPLNVSRQREWASRYLLVHTLAHVLINQLVFECGYSTASLRERLYVSADRAAPMAAFLIYTSAGDSEGTLGGLVRLGRPERFAPMVQRALSRASWCSADPVCSEHLGGQGSKLANLAACHACVLLPETTCETVNQALDRAMVVGTPESRERGMMAKLLSESFTLG